jgi:tetratricopeptide (TPR) repeat protein
VSSYRLVVRRGDELVAQGTAWLARETVAVTAFHVVGFESTGEWRHQENSEIAYLLCDSQGREIRLDPRLRDADADVAILALADPGDALAVLPLADVPLHHDEKWRAEGFPAQVHGDAFTVGGVVRDVRRDSVQLFIQERTEEPWQGMSGAPVLNVSNEVVAVMRDETVAVATLWAAHVDVVRRLLRRLDDPRGGLRLPDARQSSPRRRISWLHIADLHHGPASRWSDRRDMALRALKRDAEILGAPDLLLVTGDISDAGLPDQFEQARNALDDVRSALGGDPIVVPVPGNHDLMRPHPRSGEAKGFRGYHADQEQRELVQQGNPDAIAPIKRWFDAYMGWLERDIVPEWRRQGVKYELGLLPGDIRLSLSRHDMRLGIVGLNSAFTQIDDGNYCGELVIERQQAGRELSMWIESHEAALLLMHHPPEWLADIDAFHADVYPSERFVACLFGNAWQRPRDPRDEREGRVRRLIQAPSLFGRESCERDGKRPYGYVWGQLHGASPTRGTLRIWHRKAEPTDSGDVAVAPLSGDARRPTHSFDDVSLREVRTPVSALPMVSISTGALMEFAFGTTDRQLQQAEELFQAGDFAQALARCRDIQRDLESMGEHSLDHEQFLTPWLDARLGELACLLCMQDLDAARSALRIVEETIPEGWNPSDETRVLLARLLAQLGHPERARAWVAEVDGEEARAARQLADIIAERQVPKDMSDDFVVRQRACWIWIEDGHHERAVHEALQLLERQDNASTPRTRLLQAGAVQILLAAMSQSVSEYPRGCAVVPVEAREPAIKRLQESLDPQKSPLRGAVPDRLLAPMMAYFHDISWDIERLRAARAFLREVGEDDSAYQIVLDDEQGEGRAPDTAQLPAGAPAWARVARDALVLHQPGGRTDDALAMVEKELANDPERPRLLLHRTAAILYLARERFQDAIAQAERAVSAFPGHGQKLLLAEVLLRAGEAERIWSELRDELESSPNLRARKLLAWAASRVEPMHASHYWQEIVERLDSDGPEQAFARVEWARSLALLGETGQAANEAWAAYRSGMLDTSADALVACAELHWVSEHPDRERRLQELARALWTLADSRGDQLGHAYYVSLWLRLGRPQGLPEPDPNVLLAAGVVQAVPREQVVEFAQAVASHRTRMELEYERGALPLERCGIEGDSQDAEVFERVWRNEGVFRTPLHQGQVDASIRDREILVGSFELLLLDQLGLLPELDRALGSRGRVLLFKDVYEHILFAPHRLAGRLLPGEQQRIDDMLRFLAEHAQLLGSILHDEESEAEWAERHDSVLVRVHPWTERERSWRDFLFWLHQKGIITRKDIRTALGSAFETSQEADVEEFPGDRVSLDVTALRELMRADLLGNMSHELDAQNVTVLITPQAYDALRERQEDVQTAAAAKERAARARAWVIAMEEDGRVEKIDRPGVELTPANDDDHSRKMREWFECSLQWRRALLDRDNAVLACMDALCAQGITHGEPPGHFYLALRDRTLDQLERMKEWLERADERVVSIPALCRHLTGERYVDEVAETLIRIGFADALTAEELIRYVDELDSRSGRRLQHLLGRIEERMGRASGFDWMLHRTHIASLYATAIGSAWCTDTPAEQRETLTALLLDGAAAMDRPVPKHALRWVIKLLCAYVVDHPQWSFVRDNEGTGMRLALDESKAGQMWQVIAKWMTKQTEERRREFLESLHEEATFLLAIIDKQDEGQPDRLKLCVGPLVIAIAAFLQFEHRGQIVPGSFHDAIAILSALWPEDMRPLEAHEIPVKLDNTEDWVSIEDWLVRAARIVMESPDRIQFDGVSFHVALEVGGYALAFSPAAMVLRLEPEQRRAAAVGVLSGFGPDDGRIAAPLQRIAGEPEEGEALQSYAHKSILPPWQTFRLQPVSITRWGDISLGLRLAPTTVDELRAILSEPGPFPVDDSSLDQILHERVSAGAWHDRIDQLDLLERCGEIVGHPTLPIMWRVPAKMIDVDKSLARLGDADNHPAARIAHDLFVCLAAGASEEATQEAREEISTRVLELLERARKEPGEGSLAACEPRLLQHALWAVSMLSYNSRPLSRRSRRLSRRDGLWLTWSLYQWMIRQFEVLPEQEREGRWSKLAEIPAKRPGFIWRAQPDLLDPSRFGHDRLDIRLLAFLHAVAFLPPEHTRWLLQSRGIRRVLDELRRRPLTAEEKEVKALSAPSCLVNWGDVPRTVPELAAWILQCRDTRATRGQTSRGTTAKRPGKGKERGRTSRKRRQGKRKK